MKTRRQFIQTLLGGAAAVAAAPIVVAEILTKPKMLSIAELKRRYRQTFRINRKCMDKLKSIEPIGVVTKVHGDGTADVRLNSPYIDWEMRTGAGINKPFGAVRIETEEKAKLAKAFSKGSTYGVYSKKDGHWVSCDEWVRQMAARI